MKVQVLTALRQCLTSRFAGGVILLRDLAHYLLPIRDAVLGVDALVYNFKTSIMKKGAEELVFIRTARAEAMEYAELFTEAAALYKQNLDDHRDVPAGTSGLQNEPRMWYFYGIALRKQDDDAGAMKAYKHGLALLKAGCPLAPNTEEYRESLRLHILSLMRVILDKQPHGDASYVEQVFFRELKVLRKKQPQIHVNYRQEGPNGAAQRRLVHACAQCGSSHRCSSGGWMECMETGERWAVADYTSGGLDLLRVVRLPDRVGPFRQSPYFPDGPGRMPWTEDNAEPLPDAGAHIIMDTTQTGKSVLRKAARRGAAKLPPLQSKCGGCGVIGFSMQVCGSCKQESYCSKSCQTDAWKAHKTDCGKHTEG